MRGRPVRGFFAGLLLGILLDLDLVLSGAVKLESAVLTILPIALMLIGLLLGLWAPIGRSPRSPAPAASPLPTPMAWPESAPVEGSTPPAATTFPQTPPPAEPPPAVPPEPPPSI